MSFKLKAQTHSDLFLAFLDFLVDELFNSSATRTNDVVMMSSIIHLIGCAVIAEIVSDDKPRRLKLSQNAINGCKSDFDIFRNQLLVDVFSREMTLRPGFLRLLKEFQNAHARRSGFESDIFQFLFGLKHLMFIVYAHWLSSRGSFQSDTRYHNGKFLIYEFRDVFSTVFHMSLRTFLITAPLAVGLIALSGCNFNSYVYRTDVHQGNLVTKEMIDQLQVGMARQQVLFLMGEPLIESQFHRNRWDYAYYLNPRYGDIQMRRVTLYFDEQDILTKIEAGRVPTEKQADEMILGRETDFPPTPLVRPEDQ